MTIHATSDKPETPAAKHTILIVDDTPQNLAVLGELLQPHYRVRAANSGERALRAAGLAPRPDLILLDVMMPGMDGYEVMEHLHSDPATRNIPVIFVTAMNAAENEEHGLALGAVDYITKPINPAIVLARVRTHLELKQARDRLADENEWLEREVSRRMSENLLVQELSVRALACLSEARDNETGRHIVRTQTYVDLLARHLAAPSPLQHRHSAVPRLGMVVKAAPLHDIGKVGIPDSILLKRGRLTADEFEIMKAHPAIGADAIDKAMEQALESADEAVGSPGGRGLSPSCASRARSPLATTKNGMAAATRSARSGDAIPVSARLMALADVFDALMSQSCIQAAPESLEETTQIILDGRGSHFDPDVVEAFLACLDRFADICHALSPIPIPSTRSDGTAR